MGPSFVVILIRLVVPLSILRWPLIGGMLAILADISDVFILEKFGWGIFAGESYHVFDKSLDAYYLGLECWVAAHWQDARASRIAVGLFAMRVAGLVVFQTTGSRAAFVAAPNVFENVYLLWFLLPGLRSRLGLLLVIAAVPKVVQEILMHYWQFGTWEYFRNELFYWIF